jgi:ribosome-associated protein
MIQITPTLAIGDHEIEERFVRASGPGGQNVNKVATAVELRFNVAASALPAHVKARLAVLAGSRLSGDGVLVIDSRAHRTQSQNREEARERLIDLLRQATIVPKKRHKTKVSRAERERRIGSKKHRSTVKSLRRRGGDD